MSGPALAPSRLAVIVAAFACGGLAWRATHPARVASPALPCSVIDPPRPHPPGYVVAQDEDMPLSVMGTVVRISDELSRCGDGHWRVVTFRTRYGSAMVDVVVAHGDRVRLWHGYVVETQPVDLDLTRAIEAPRPVRW